MAIRSPEERLADLAKRKAKLKRDIASLKQVERRTHERRLMEAGAVVEQAGALDWPKEKLLAVLKSGGADGTLDS